MTNPTPAPATDALIERLEARYSATDSSSFPNKFQFKNPDGPTAVQLIRHLQAELAEARGAALEEAARVAESDDLILSESRSPSSFGKTRKDHGLLIASQIRTLKGDKQ